MRVVSRTKVRVEGHIKERNEYRLARIRTNDHQDTKSILDHLNHHHNQLSQKRYNKSVGIRARKHWIKSFSFSSATIIQRFWSIDSNHWTPKNWLNYSDQKVALIDFFQQQWCLARDIWWNKMKLRLSPKWLDFVRSSPLAASWSYKLIGSVSV